MRQLSGMDVSFLNMETPTTFGHVSSLNIYDPTTAPGGAGLEATKEIILERMDQLAPFRRRLVEVPLGLDLPQIGGEVELLTSAEETDLFVEMVRMQLLEGDVKKEREDLKARFRKSHDLGKYHVPGVGKISRRMQDGKLSWDSQGLSDFVELAAAKHGFSYDPAMFNKRGADFEVINVYPDKEMRGS